MTISVEKLISYTFYVALFIFAASACYIMYGQESYNGGAHITIITFATLVSWIALIFLRFSLKGLVINWPSKIILLYSIYGMWAIIITTLSGIENPKEKELLLNVMTMTLPLVVMNAVYYYILHYGNSRFLHWSFVAISGMFLVTYISIFDISNLLDNIHLGASYYMLFLLPLVLTHPSKAIKIACIVITALAVFSSIKRAGIMSVVLSVFTFIIIGQVVANHSKKRNFIVGVIFLSLFVGALIFVTTIDDLNIIERFENIGKDNGSGRAVVWNEAWRLINNQDVSSYIIGNGYNEVLKHSRFNLSAHDDYLEAWYDFGLIGLILYVSAVGSLIVFCFKTIREKYVYAPQVSMLTVIVIIQSLLSHIAIYFWMSVVVMNIGFFAAHYDRTQQRSPN